MVKDPKGIYHYTGWEVPDEGDPLPLPITYCRIRWQELSDKGEDWWISYLLSADYNNFICKECIKSDENI